MSHAKRRPKKGRRYGRDRGHKPQPTATGTLHIHEGGRARVVCQEGTFRVAHGGLHEAMNGDKVAVSGVVDGWCRVTGGYVMEQFVMTAKEEDDQ